MLIGFGDSSINVEIRPTCSRGLREFLAIQEHLILDIMQMVEAAGSGFAFPSQTTYFVRDGELNETKKRVIEEEMRLRRLGPNAHAETT